MNLDFTKTIALLKKILVGGAEKEVAAFETPTSVFDIGGIPRYPAIEEPIAVCKAKAILDSQKNIIDEIKKEFSPGVWLSYVLPAIEAVSEYVGLLPASETDHHSMAGGLFRHKLEVVLIALQRLAGGQYEANSLPSEKTQRQVSRKVAVTYCALSHDLGKLISDIKVYAENGDIWSPFRHSLLDWAMSNEYSHVFIEFKKRRIHGAHEVAGSVLSPYVLPREGLALLGETANDILQDAIFTICQTPSVKQGYLSASAKTMYTLIKDADAISAQRDRERVVRFSNERENPLPPQQLIVRAIRALTRQAFPNRVGSPLHYIKTPENLLQALLETNPQVESSQFEELLFIEWRAIAEAATSVSDSRVKAVMQDQDGKRLIQLLVEHDYVMPIPVDSFGKRNLIEVQADLFDSESSLPVRCVCWKYHNEIEVEMPLALDAELFFPGEENGERRPYTFTSNKSFNPNGKKSENLNTTNKVAKPDSEASQAKTDQRQINKVESIARTAVDSKENWDATDAAPVPTSLAQSADDVSPEESKNQASKEISLEKSREKEQVDATIKKKSLALPVVDGFSFDSKSPSKVAEPGKKNTNKKGAKKLPVSWLELSIPTPSKPTQNKERDAVTATDKSPNKQKSEKRSLPKPAATNLAKVMPEPKNAQSLLVELENTHCDSLDANSEDACDYTDIFGSPDKIPNKKSNSDSKADKYPEISSEKAKKEQQAIISEKPDIKTAYIEKDKGQNEATSNKDDFIEGLIASFLKEQEGEITSDYLSIKSIRLVGKAKRIKGSPNISKEEVEDYLERKYRKNSSGEYLIPREGS